MVAGDLFDTQWERVKDPAENIVLITPDDDNDLALATRGLSFGTAGALKVDTLAGQTVVIPNGALAAGIIHPIRVTRVYATGTDAAGIVGYY